MHSLGFFILGVLVFCFGLFGLLGLHISDQDVIAHILALVSGALIMFGGYTVWRA